MRLKRRLPAAAVWALFGLFLLFAMGLSFMYLDDLGYASLSYGIVQPGVTGQAFTAAQFFHYLTGVYTGWTGRVVFPALEILLLKNIWFYRAVQAALVLVAFLALYVLSTKRRGAMTALFTCALYGFFAYEMYRNGFYWFSASATYVLPLAFLFMGIALAGRREGKALPAGSGPGAQLSTFNFQPSTIFAALCFLLAAASQEQTAFTAVGYATLMCVFDHGERRKNKERAKFSICHLQLAVCLSGAAFLFLAPGNFKRFGQYSAAAPMSIFHKVYANAHALFTQYICLQNNILFLLLFACFICYIAYALRKGGKLRPLLFGGAIASSALFLALPFLALDVTATLMWRLTFVWFYIYVLLASALILRWLLLLRERRLAALYIGALASQAAMLFYAPYIVERMSIVFYCAVFALFIRAFSEIRSRNSGKKLAAAVLLPVLLLSAANMAYISRGYFENRAANVYNIDLLRQTSAKIKAGAKIDSVTLMPLADEKFGIEWPQWATAYLHEFYDIPDSVRILAPPAQG